MLRVAVVGLALVLLASLPGVIAWVIVNADEAADRAGQTVARLRPHVPAHPPVEHTAALLRQLSAQLAETPLSQATRRGRLIDRYDAVLREACATLDIPQYLSRLTGSDADAERLRLEGMLEAQGLVVRGPATDHDSRA
jgi:hypothetical protein